MGPAGPSIALRKPTWQERYVAQPRASKRLDYQGHKIRFHMDATGCHWFVLIDIARALEKRKTSPLRNRIKDPNNIMSVLAWVPNAANPAGGGGAMIPATNMNGIEAMLTFNSLAGASEFLGWIHTAIAALEAA